MDATQVGIAGRATFSSRVTKDATCRGVPLEVVVDLQMDMYPYSKYLLRLGHWRHGPVVPSEVRYENGSRTTHQIELSFFHGDGESWGLWEGLPILHTHLTVAFGHPPGPPDGALDVGPHGPVRNGWPLWRGAMTCLQTKHPRPHVQPRRTTSNNTQQLHSCAAHVVCN